MPESVVGVDFDYTYNGTLERDVVFCPSVETPSLSDFMRIVQGSKYKIQIPYVDTIQKVIKKYQNCNRTYTDGIDILNTTVELCQLELNMQWCKDNFEGTVGNILAEEWLRSGVDEFNPEGTEIQTVIDRLVSDAARRDTFRIFSFGNTASLSDDYNQLDGLWTKLIAGDSPSEAYCVKRVANLGLSDLGNGAALEALEAAYTESDIILKQLPNNQKYFAVTGSVYENLLASYEANVNGTERQFTNLTMGQGDQGSSLMYRGIPVNALYAWDNSLQDPDNPLFGLARHLILYTTRDNHVVGVDVQEDATRISGWYERKDRRYYIEGFQRLGYNYVCCGLQSIAY